MYFSMSKTVLPSLFKKPATRLYPYVQRKPFKNTRGKVEINISSCSFCSFCQRKCPTGAITVTKTDKKWEINRLQCIACNACVELCPKKCLSMENCYTTPEVASRKDSFRDARVSDNTANTQDS